MATSSPIFDPAVLIEQILQRSGGVRKLTSPGGKVVGRAFNYAPGVIECSVTYSLHERNLIVDQLRLALSQFYVHLERKNALYNFDPVRALDLLVPTLKTLSNTEFHQSIIKVLAKTRDRHLSFSGKTPDGLSAGLCFSVERCWAAERAQYIVTKIDSRVKTERLRVGAVVTHWNGVEIEKYLRLNAEAFGDGNDAASFARSLAFLTQRPLRDFGQPVEDSVELGFSLNGAALQERFIWEGLDVSRALNLSIYRRMFSGDPLIIHLQLINRARFARQSLDHPPFASDSDSASASDPASALVSDSASASAPDPACARDAGTGVPQKLDPSDILKFHPVTTQHGTFGYIRLWSFAADYPDEIVDAFIDILPQLPKNGLIIDMRGNGGGYIPAGEHLLQLFTLRPITPLRFQYRVTPATKSMISATGELKAWQQSTEEAFATGEPYSQGYPMEGSDADANNMVGQRYFGPVVIITDALAFSTADMFVAGFIDHEIGAVICTDENMGAAGGNPWTWDQVRMAAPDFELDPKHKSSLDKGELSAEIRKEFSCKGTPLSGDAKLWGSMPAIGGQAWPISDGKNNHRVRYLKCSNRLFVCPARSRLGFVDLPIGVNFRITMLRCMRTGKNEGKLIEDLGITPVEDQPYLMTRKDITEQNQDLITEASLQLTKMPVYDLDIQVRAVDKEYVLKCSTLNLTSVQVFVGDRYLTGGNAANGQPIELSVPNQYDSVVAFGFKNDEIVAKSIIVSPSAPSS